MSDLASFVAASIRDKALQDLLEENRRLQEKNRNALRFCPFRPIKITGPRGAPVYYNNDEVYFGRSDWIYVDLHGSFRQRSRSDKCFFRDTTLGELLNSEICIDGSPQAVVVRDSQFSTMSYINKFTRSLEIKVDTDSAAEEYLTLILGPFSKEELEVIVPNSYDRTTIVTDYVQTKNHIALGQLVRLNASTKVSYAIHRSWFLKQLVSPFGGPWSDCHKEDWGEGSVY